MGITNTELAKPPGCDYDSPQRGEPSLKSAWSERSTKLRQPAAGGLGPEFFLRMREAGTAQQLAAADPPVALRAWAGRPLRRTAELCY